MFLGILRTSGWQGGDLKAKGKMKWDVFLVASAIPIRPLSKAPLLEGNVKSLKMKNQKCRKAPQRFLQKKVGECAKAKDRLHKKEALKIQRLLLDNF